MNALIFQQPPTLENNRVKLVPMQQEHAPLLYKICNHDLWTHMLGNIEKEEDMEKWVANALRGRQAKTSLPFVVMLKESKQVIGTTRVYDMSNKMKSCEIGYTWYAMPYQRTYVNSDCKYLLLQYCFEQLEYIRVQFKTDEWNIRSQKAIERLGAVKEGIIRNERIHINGYIRNAVLYSITNQDWMEVKQKFLKREKEYTKTQNQA
ncbi:GNAT family N-acetyltransferase [Ectobacillus polymachus]|uniref:GNAT family N-acetyltransferase n=1 Tax=Ectobacillus polymachus TaxID=1508806 RepID=UPI003A85025A